MSLKYIKTKTNMDLIGSLVKETPDSYILTEVIELIGVVNSGWATKDFTFLSDQKKVTVNKSDTIIASDPSDIAKLFYSKHYEQTQEEDEDEIIYETAHGYYH